MSYITPEQQLVVALDVATIAAAHELATVLFPVITTFKIGYSLMFEPGLHSLISSLKLQNKKVFLDAKLNDIPETVRRGVASAGRNGIDFITVHSDEAMLAAAMIGRGDLPIKVMAVTALTSQPIAASRDRFRAGLINAAITGCDGVIMSPADLRDPIRLVGDRLADCGNLHDLLGKMIIATPGVRMPGKVVDDHGRSGSPAQAAADGADYIIVGRPIIEADEPLEQAAQFIEQIAIGLDRL